MFRILNDAALDGTGAPMRHPFVVLSCVAILLAAATKGGLGCGGSAANDNDDDDARGKFKSANDGNAAVVA